MSDDGPRPARDSDLAKLSRYCVALARAVREQEVRLAALEDLMAAHRMEMIAAHEFDEAIDEGLGQLVDEVASWRAPR